MKRFLVIIVALGSIFTTSGCDSKSRLVCTTSYPIEYLVQRIAGEHINTCNLSGDTVIQATTIKTNYKDILEESDILFHVSGMEPYFELYGQDIRTIQSNYVDLSTFGYFYDFNRYQRVVDNNSKPSELPYYQGDVFNDINTYNKDPFVWMDPLMMLSSAETIRDYLINEYPELEKEFQKNYKELEIDLTSLDAQYQTIYNSNKNISFISLTPSFGNWQNTIGIQVYPVILSKYGALPNDNQLAIIKQKIIDDGVLYIAHEQNLTPEMEILYTKLVEELGLIPIELSNLSSLSASQQEKNQDYLTIMYENFKVLESIGN